MHRAFGLIGLVVIGVACSGAQPATFVPANSPSAVPTQAAPSTPRAEVTVRPTDRPAGPVTALPSGAVRPTSPAFVAKADPQLARDLLAAVNERRTAAGKPACTADGEGTEQLRVYLDAAFPGYSFEKPVTALIDFNSETWKPWRGVFAIDLEPALRDVKSVAARMAADPMVSSAERTRCAALAYTLPDGHAFVGVWTR